MKSFAFWSLVAAAALPLLPSRLVAQAPATGPIRGPFWSGTVMRGMKMPGHMGVVRRTSQNLEIIQVRPDDNVLLIKGNFPGSEGDYCIIREAKKISINSARLKQITDARKKAKDAATAKKDDKKAAAAAKKK